MTRASDTAKLLGAGGSILGSLDVGGGQIGGRRNVVINGAMNIAQRATSVTDLGSGSGSYPTCDRFAVSQTATAGRYTMTQEADGPSGFANCIKLDCTTADTSIAASEFFLLRQRIEGQNLQMFAKGTSDAKQYSLSFYVKGNANATYVAELMDNDNSNRHVGKTFAVTTSWNRIEMLFPADTTGAFADDNGASLDLNIWLHSGSDRTSGTLQQTWGALAQTNRAVGISSFFSSTDNTFFITGVQLEVGSVATPFEHLSAGESLQLCQRYYSEVSVGYYAGNGSGTTKIATGMPLPTPLRAAPSSIAGLNVHRSGNQTASVTIDSIGFSANSSFLYIRFTGFSSGTDEAAFVVYLSANMLLDSEL
tara:strand:- start:146 stop:1240 length:1095 start_codon:yes stop_codon:yes gene_type:complete